MNNKNIQIDASSQKKKFSMRGFGHKTMNTLSTLSKAFLLPIALLPIAGVFLGVGAAIANQGGTFYDVTGTIVVGHDWVWYIGTVMNKMGDVAFGNLPILFCISVALAYTKDAGVAAITAVVGFLVMNGMQAALIHANLDPITGTPIKGSDGVASWSLLWYGTINSGLITSNLGINSLNTGILAGIFVGAISAWAYNKFHRTQLPSAIAFFSGTKLVPIITFFAVIPLSFIFMFIWPLLGSGIAKLGVMAGDLPMGVSSLVFEVIERSLVPFGLHHVFYSPLWWTAAGGSLAETANAAAAVWGNGADIIGDLSATFNGITGLEWQEQVSAFSQNPVTWEMFYKAVSDIPDFASRTGDQYAMSALISHIDNTKGINFESFELLGLNLGQYQSGKFGFMMLGLPMAAAAMMLNVPKENRKNVMGIYLSAAFTCFLTGITEPIEYTFLFLAPWLFYGVHMPLAAISFFFAGFMGTHVSMTVSGGFIDYIVFGLVPYLNGAMDAMSAFGILIVTAAMGPIYFIAFYLAVKYGKVMVPGRDGAANAQLATKADYKELKSSGTQVSATTDSKEAARMQKAAGIIKFLGGAENIENVDACASRLRVNVKDASKVDKNGIMSLGGSTGILIRGSNVQVVYGGEQEAIKPRMLELLNNKNGSKPATVEPIKKEEKAVVAKKPEVKKAPAKVTAKPVAKKAVVKKEPVKKAEVKPAAKPLTEVQKRALTDGSSSIKESRQELQKKASALRKTVKQNKIKFVEHDLRDMTKKEVMTEIEYLKKTIAK